MKTSEHEILKKILPLLLCRRAITSKADLAKRARISDDTLGRFCERFEREHGFALVGMDKGRLALTDKGRRAYELYSEIWTLGDAEEFALAKLNLQAESILGGLLSAALVSVLEMWGSTIDRPLIWRLETDVRRRMGEGNVDLAVGFADAGEIVGDGEALGVPVEWCVLAPVKNRLGGELQEPLSVDQLPNKDWLLLPDLAFGGIWLADSFVRGGQKRVMECDHLATYVAAGVGLAVLPDVLGSRCPHGTVKRGLVGLPALQPRLFLPRGGEAALSSQNQCLVETMRRLVRDGFFGGDKNSNAPATAEVPGKQEAPAAKTEDEDVFEEMVEGTATPMAAALS
jgi:DNA-binding transcriptional LysR family regulator